MFGPILVSSKELIASRGWQLIDSEWMFNIMASSHYLTGRIKQNQYINLEWQSSELELEPSEYEYRN
jgi:hypothetical protein